MGSDVRWRVDGDMLFLCCSEAGFSGVGLMALGAVAGLGAFVLYWKSRQHRCGGY